MNLRILPTLVRGSSSSKVISRGRFAFASRSAHHHADHRPRADCRHRLRQQRRPAPRRGLDRGHRRPTPRARGVCGEYGLDLDRRDVLTGYFQARRSAGRRRRTGQSQVRAGPVAGEEPSISEACVGRVRIIEIPDEERDATVPRTTISPTDSLGRVRRRSPSRLGLDLAPSGDIPHRVGSWGSTASVSTAGMVSVMPYSWRGRQPNQAEIVSYWSSRGFVRTSSAAAQAISGRSPRKDHSHRSGKEAGARCP